MILLLFLYIYIGKHIRLFHTVYLRNISNLSDYSTEHLLCSRQTGSLDIAVIDHPLILWTGQKYFLFFLFLSSLRSKVSFCVYYINETDNVYFFYFQILVHCR
jgi:hypothetical protein